VPFLPPGPPCHHSHYSHFGSPTRPSPPSTRLHLSTLWCPTPACQRNWSEAVRTLLLVDSKTTRPTHDSRLGALRACQCHDKYMVVIVFSSCVGTARAIVEKTEEP
jgi:hypothetical protein